MKSVLFSIGKINVYGYGTMIALGLILCFTMACIRAKKYKIDPDTIFNAGIIGVIFGLIGAKITYWIVNLKSVIADPSMLLDLGGGFVVYGGLILGVLAAVFYLKKIKKTTVLDKLDLAMPSIALGQGVGRIGCFLAGCCYGKTAPEGAWYAVTFPADSLAPSGVPLVPIQLISSILLLLLMGILLVMTKKQRARGTVVAAYMVLYSLGRFYVEFYRDEPRGNVWIFSTSQFIAIFVVIAGILLFPVFRNLNRKPLISLAAENGEEDTEEEPEENAAEDTKETEETPEEASKEAAEDVSEESETQETPEEPEEAPEEGGSAEMPDASEDSAADEPDENTEDAVSEEEKN